ncbi:MAG: DNA polymerase III subunit beta [Candidatus Omnitrophica bacterium]|nr:DNA polymerase III subunit beta [Candidatus Omnitrophota bacterium]MCK5288444.1 DNA polymerase III subunit beta [Candidatus Omnitrophota bacterium]MCK5392962.1 DNA polymerase III subunit beta [Candidatus Omnitrophota bacterium]
MKFKIEKEILIDKLTKGLGPTTTKQNFPILNSILLNLNNKKLKYVTTDLDTTIISFDEIDSTDTGQVAVPMKRFISIIRELPQQDIILEKVKNNLLIKCEKIEFKLNTLNCDEFPQIQEEKTISLVKLDPQKLEEMIRLTSFCVGYEDVNYVLNGILFEIEKDKINLVATDGKRLSFIQKNLPETQPEIETKISFILPIKAVNELYKLIKERENEIFLFVEKNKVGFDFKDTQFIARPIEGEFPNYSQYIPGKGKDRLEINRKELLFALRRANLLSTTEHQGVKIELRKDSFIVYKNTPQLGEVKESVNCKYNGGSLEIGFNPNYLIDVLKNLEDNIVFIDFFSADKPTVIRKEGYIYLLLPMKI